MIPTLVTGAGVLALLVAERERLSRKGWFKAVASIGFIWLALSDGSPETVAGRLILVGLVLSFIGDMALVREDGFLVGLIAFALAHVAYTAAFVATGFNPWFAVPAAVATVFLFRVIRRWLNWKVPRWMERPVLSYMVLISIMMVAASGTTNGRIFVGAGLFYLSDLAVARNRFIDDTFGNKLFGLPLYYAGQLILATVVT